MSDLTKEQLAAIECRFWANTEPRSDCMTCGEMTKADIRFLIDTASRALDSEGEIATLRAEVERYRIGYDIDRQTIERLEAHIAREKQEPDPDAPSPAFERWRCRAHTAERDLSVCRELLARVHDEVAAFDSDPGEDGIWFSNELRRQIEAAAKGEP